MLRLCSSGLHSSGVRPKRRLPGRPGFPNRRGRRRGGYRHGEVTVLRQHQQQVVVGGRHVRLPGTFGLHANTGSCEFFQYICWTFVFFFTGCGCVCPSDH